MSLFQIYYENADNGQIDSLYAAAPDLESAVKRFRQLYRGRIVQVIERSGNFIS